MYVTGIKEPIKLYAMKLWYVSLFLFTILSAGLFSTVNAQEDPLNKFVSQLQKYQYDRLYEKVHLHLDKPYYAIGDIIWFKAYIVQADGNKPSTQSKILYAELINERDSIVQTLRLPIMVGLAWGEFNLTESLTEGNYRIRAYTTWMRNFGSDFFFDRRIPIGNALTNNIITSTSYSFSKDGSLSKLNADIIFKDIDGNAISNKDVEFEIMHEGKMLAKGAGKTDSGGHIRITSSAGDLSSRQGTISTRIKLDSERSFRHRLPIKATSSEVNLQFFPEGGDLVAGLRSTVAVKATGPDNLIKGLRGFVIDGNNNPVTEFALTSRGSDKFVFRPVSGSSYRALVKFPDGSESTFKLPDAQPDGFVLSVTNIDPENIKVDVSASARFSGTDIILIARSNNKIQLVSKNKLSGPRFAVNIPAKRFPHGLLHLTLLTSDAEPKAERLIFINHNEQLHFDIQSEVRGMGTRSKSGLSVGITDKEGKPVLGSFSVSVLDESKVPFDEDNEITILSNLLLTSELKGDIPRANYFFTSVDSTKIRELDLLMLTQGWRRFEWKDVQTNKQAPLVFQPEQSIAVSGRVTQGGKPVVNGSILLFYMDGMAVSRDTTTDEFGKFRFTDLNFTDGTKMVLQAKNARDNKNVKIELDQVASELITPNKNLDGIEVNVNKSMLDYLKNSMVQYDSLRRIASSSIMLDEVRVVEKKVDFSASRNLNGGGNADAIIMGDKIESFCVLTLNECLQGLLTGVIMKDGVPYLSRSLSSSILLPTHMLVLVDGADVGPDGLSYIMPQEVEFIEVLKTAISTGTYGTKGAGGVLLITLKRGKPRTLSGPSYTPGLVQFYEKGLHKPREFYSPPVTTEPLPLPAKDLRTTIYWNPMVVTDKEGKAKLEFVNAGNTGTYKVIIEGIDAYGNIGRGVYRFPVR